MDWSYGALSKAEQTLLRRLSVFSGGWTLEFAEQVCFDKSLPAQDISLILFDLVSKSLVTIVPSGQYAQRFTFLETVRVYASEHLSQEERTALQARHARYFAAWLNACWQAFSNPNQPNQAARQIEVMEMEFGNLNTFLVYDCLSEHALLTPEAVRALYHFCLSRCRVREGQSWMSAYLQNALLSDATRGSITYNLGNLAMLVGDYTGARTHYEVVCRELYCRIGERERLATLLGNLGWLAIERGAYTELERLLEEGLALSEAHDIVPGKAWNYQCLYAMALERGQYDRAEAYLRQRLVVDPDYRQSIGPEKGQPAYRAGAWALLEHLRGATARAAELYRECLTLYLEADYKIEGGRLAQFAALLSATDPRQSARWFGASATIEWKPAPYYSFPGIRRLITMGQATCRASLGDAAYQIAYEEGAALDWKEAFAEAIGAE